MVTIYIHNLQIIHKGSNRYARYFSPSRRWDSRVVSLLYLLKEKVSSCVCFNYYCFPVCVKHQPSV